MTENEKGISLNGLDVSREELTNEIENNFNLATNALDNADEYIRRANDINKA